MVVRRLLIASAMLLLSVPARAARPHDAVALEYLPSAATAARCPAADFLREEVQIRIGYDLFQPEAPPRLTVKIDRFEGEYRVTGELRSPEGDVTLDGTFTEVECGAAIRSLAIAVAIRFTRPPQACSLPRPPVTARTATAPPEPKPTKSPSAVAAPPRVQIGIASAFSVGTAPVVVGGAAWFLGARWVGFSAALEGRALFASATGIVGTREQDGYRLFATEIAASGCVHPTWAFACVQVEWASLAFGNTALNIDPNRLSHLGFGLRFGGERVLTRSIALRAYVDTLFNLGPGNLTNQVPGARFIWHQPAFSGAMGFGPVMTF